MGQAVAGRTPQRMKSVLGSCVGLALYHPRHKAGALAHIVLPDSDGRAGLPGKFADTAIPYMLEILREMGVASAGLTAKFAGGANMFGGPGPLQIGDANVEAVIEGLKSAGIRVSGKDIGGTAGRRVTFDCSSGEMLIESIGKAALTL